MARKFLTAKADLVEKINEIAKKEGRTIFSIVNEALEAFLIAYEKNTTLFNIIEELKIIETAKNAGMIFVPENFHEYLISYISLDRNICKSWRESGYVFGKHLEANNIKEPKHIERAIKYVIGENSEIIFSENKIVCICPKMGERRTEEIAEFLEGLVESYGFIVVTKEVSKGIIIIRIKKGVKY
ncbi:MAG: hypothetical protein QXW62_00885 [Candidatus Methanomethylicaceae archaeon]|nr:hypothetical protein [Candidatus Verstraetearchaeota archaeon]